MGRRLNVSTPTVINTELVPLDESFYLDVDGQMEQWYYDNTEQYAPNRKVTPLLLVPFISVFDKDTSTSYTPAFNTTQWFANEWNEAQGKYVETEITNRVDSGSADYVIQGNNLLVKKNVSYSHAVSIRCVATYIDPRDGGLTYTVEDNINLTTNRTADVGFPEVDIISPSGRAYNPLVDDENSQYDFKGVTTNNPVQPMNTDVRRYPVDVDGTEEILNSGEAVAPIMDIRYGENLTSENQEFMYRQTAGGTLVGESIDKAYIERINGNTVAWNQYINPSNLATSNNEISNLSFNDGSFSYKLTTNPSGQHGSGFGIPNFVFIAGHKYYYSSKFDVAPDNLLNYYFRGVGTNIEVNLGTNKEIKGIYSCTATQTASIVMVGMIVSSASTTTNIKQSNYNILDLTLIYGAGNEPTTVEQFEADYKRWFGKPLSYEEYDAGSLRPVLMQSVKTTGFNQWDEEWEAGAYDETGEKQSYDGYIRSANAVPILPNTPYKIACSAVVVFLWYDADGNFIKRDYDTRYSANGNIHTSPENAHYLRFHPYSSYGSTYNHDICVNISNPSKNGTYEPYEEKVQGFDVTAIKGKLNGAGNSVTIFPDGLKKAGNVQDEIFVEDGVVKAVKRVGSVDLGSLMWAKQNSGAFSGGYFFVAAVPDIVEHIDVNDCVNSKYIYTATASPQEKTFGRYNSTLRIYDSSYSDAAAFKTAMSGVMLYYELETPETYVLDPITDFVWYGIKEGQEVLADTLPWYVSGQGTDNLVVDAMYGENINVVLRCKMMDGETLSPSKAYATLNWRIPDIETFVQSDNGGAVRSDTQNMTFDTIVNVNGVVLSDALKQKHLAFNWKIRKNDTSTEVDKGWGQRITIDASELRSVKGSGSTLSSTLVGNEVYIKGAYEEVTDNGEIVTDNGEVVYDRPVTE